MPDKLCRLVYCSQNAIGGDAEMLAAAIGSILAKSQINNGRIGVTGALMFNSGWFGQVLEGPCGTVETVFRRIQWDLRHRHVALLACDPVKARAFGNSPMRFIEGAVGKVALEQSKTADDVIDDGQLLAAALFETLNYLTGQKKLRTVPSKYHDQVASMAWTSNAAYMNDLSAFLGALDEVRAPLD